MLARQGKQHDVPLIMGGSSFEGTVQPASGITLDDFRRFHEHDWMHMALCRTPRILGSAKSSAEKNVWRQSLRAHTRTMVRE